MNDTFDKEIIELSELDLSVREKLSEAGELSGGYHPEMEKVHKANAKRLREIMTEIGFPTISRVGEKASNAAWLIIQHSIGEPEFMKHCYIMMEENIDDINPKNRAYLYDRIQVFQGKPQKYGTQFIENEIPYPVENKENLNNKRLKVGLLPLSLEDIERIPDSENIPEIEIRDVEYTNWRKKIGWI
ncbi:DUF6624 domain-containing protein [Chryseobacterium oncorhynchi]|uniref:Uncharacterized protein n=1 Tax=Chryseobacterium oncorhynchi TaxID=741074 RepID=A0A316X0F0_9FLAO|nr:DUF6624 domain-containing protein [Chryseobacterium oncorhynchi]PWN66126.1 hypothetical protein C1638_007045 [Chryseobacterium oncorhynchi]